MSHLQETGEKDVKERTLIITDTQPKSVKQSDLHCRRSGDHYWNHESLYLM